MSNSWFQFKQFTIRQDRCAMKVTTDACLFGAWLAEEIKNVRMDSFGEKLIINNCLDIGAGSGLLPLMVSQKNPFIKFDAVEIDEAAAIQAEENVSASPWLENISIINADVRSFDFEKKYDCIISNPPFYENELKSADEKKNQAHHGSDLKLNELIAVIKQNLSPEGIFFLLLPFKRIEEIRNIFKDHQLQISITCFVRQSTEHDYFRILLKGKLSNWQEAATEIEEIAVMDDKQQYTSRFAELLKAYYLHL